MIAFGANIWFPQLPYTLSLYLVFISLELIRWRGFGFIAAIVSGLSFCLASGAAPEQYLIYCVGNLAALLTLLFIKVIGSERIRTDNTLRVIYVVLVFVLVQLGRWTVSTLLGHDPMLIVQFVTTDALSGLFGVIVITLLRNVDGLFEDQKKYLLRLDAERKEKEKEENYINYYN